jgi:TRAP-type uncharacterized transport system substrate-binding protein
MRRWRQIGIVLAVCAASVVSLAAIAQFLAPSLSYQIRDRAAETLSGRRGRPFRIALGVAAGSYYHLGAVLNRRLREKAGYELELVATAGVPENVGALLDPSRHIDLATIESSSDEAVDAKGLYGLAAVGRQYFFVVVPADSAVREVRDLTGPINPGVRAAGQAPTLGEKVLDYYGLLASPAGRPPAVSIVRPLHGSIIRDFEAGHMTAATRTQFLHADLIDDVLSDGRYRLAPIRDHEALARALPGTAAGVIPAGAYGPQRRTPPEPVPTLTVQTLLVARADLPGRVASDILDVVYDPRFAREIGHELTEESGRNVGSVPLHPAAEIFYRRNELVTSDRIGRLSFVASIIGAAFAGMQFVVRARQNERRRARRRLLAAELVKLNDIRHRIEQSLDEAEARALVGEADDLLSEAEQDAASDRLDAEGIQSLRSLHGICWRALQQRPTLPVVGAIARPTRGSSDKQETESAPSFDETASDP